MKLRTQLLLVSLFILVLPWAGCQYIREMEQVLLDGQARELVARGQAIAAHIQSQANGVIRSTDEVGAVAAGQLYFHPLTVEPAIDGYSDVGYERAIRLGLYIQLVILTWRS